MNEEARLIFPRANLLVACVHFDTVGDVQAERALTALSQALRPACPNLLLYCNNALMSLATVRTLAPLFPARAIQKFYMRVDPFQRDPPKSHPYTVNEVMRFAQSRVFPYVLFTRTDYLLTPYAIDSLVEQYNAMATPMMAVDPFVSGWIYQTAYDREQVDLPEPDYEALPWRERGAQVLIDLPGYQFHETDLDAGVWLTSVKNWHAIAKVNERMTSWGYAQSTWQRTLKNAGVPFSVVPTYVAVHQWHGIWARDHAKARAEYDQYGVGCDHGGPRPLPHGAARAARSGAVHAREAVVRGD